MRTRIIVAILLAAAASLTACSTSYDDGDRPAAGKSRIDTVDPAEDMAFGKTYTWPDGLKVTVTEARLFTVLTADEGPADPKNYEFRAKLRLTNGGKAAADLSDISTIVMGATENAITAAPSAFQNGAAPPAGHLAPGATATKTYDAVIDRRYGRKILVIVQRGSSAALPEFIGSIVGLTCPNEQDRDSPVPDVSKRGRIDDLHFTWHRLVRGHRPNKYCCSKIMATWTNHGDLPRPVSKEQFAARTWQEKCKSIRYLHVQADSTSIERRPVQHGQAPDPRRSLRRRSGLLPRIHGSSPAPRPSFIGSCGSSRAHFSLVGWPRPTPCERSGKGLSRTRPSSHRPSDDAPDTDSVREPRGEPLSSCGGSAAGAKACKTSVEGTKDDSTPA